MFVGGCFHGTEQGEVPPADRAFQAAGLLDGGTGRAEPGENGGRQIHLLGSGCYFKQTLSPALNIDLDGQGQENVNKGTKKFNQSVTSGYPPMGV